MTLLSDYKIKWYEDCCFGFLTKKFSDTRFMTNVRKIGLSDLLCF